MAKVNKKLDTNQAAKKLVDSSIGRLEAKIAASASNRERGSKKGKKKSQ